MHALCQAVIVGLLLGATPVVSQVDPFAPVRDDPRLLRVLLIGDSISIGYTVPVRSLLAGKANVHRVPDNCQSTVYALEHIKEWLGDGKWDVIHFNWGIWDAHHMEDGSLRTTPEQYEKNLRQLVAILKATPAKLIWATTTPVDTPLPHTGLWVSSRDIIAHGAVARRVMRENKIPIDDLFADVLPRVGELRAEDGCHYTPEGCEFLAARVAKSISKELAAPKPSRRG